MSLYRKKPVVIEAVQLLWSTWSEVCEFAPVGENGCRGGFVKDNQFTDDFPGEDGVLALIIPTLEGDMLATEGDWVVRGISGEFYPVKPEIFEQTYELVEERV